MISNEASALQWQSLVDKCSTEDDIATLMVDTDEVNRYQLGIYLLESKPEFKSVTLDVIFSSLYFDIESDDKQLAEAAQSFEDLHGHQKQINKWLEKLDEQGGLMLRSEKLFWFIHHSAQNAGQWQVTCYTERCGGPMGDMQFDTKEKIFGLALGSGIPGHAKEIPMHYVDKVITKLNGPAIELKTDKGLSLIEY